MTVYRLWRRGLRAILRRGRRQGARGGFRGVWLLEEMGLAYRLRPVDLLAGVEKDPEFLAINPGRFIPAIQDGDVTMVESIAILEYLMARYRPTPLAPATNLEISDGQQRPK